MLKSCFVFLQLAVVGISVLGVNCLTEDEEGAIVDALKPMIMDCIQECGLTEEDLKQEKAGEINGCVKKCILKRLGVLTPEGKYDREAVKQQMMAFSDSEDDANKFVGALDNCFKGQDGALKDEDKKVDIIFECLQNIKDK